MEVCCSFQMKLKTFESKNFPICLPTIGPKIGKIACKKCFSFAVWPISTEFQISLPVFQEWWRSLSYSLFHFDHHRSCAHVLFGNYHGPVHSQWCHTNLGHLPNFQRNWDWNHNHDFVCQCLIHHLDGLANAFHVCKVDGANLLDF